jgi:DNA-binding transcriptional LysR family regulator
MNASGQRYKQNRVQQLRGFCYAASLGSVSKAAKLMSLSQPAVSQQIQSLENELAVKLFSRESSHIRLTHDGELLLDMARPLIEELEHLDEEFRERRSDAEEGHIEVAAGQSTIMYFLPQYVGEFRRTHPRIEIRLQSVTGLEGLERLRTGRVDFAVGPVKDVPGDIEFHPVVSYDPVVITCRGHPLVSRKRLTLEDISRYPLILPPRNLSTWPMVDSTFKKHGLSYEVAMEVGGWEVIKKYVELDLGISIIISIGIRGEENLEVIPAAQFFPRRTYGVVLRKGKVLSPQARRFVNLLLSAAKPGAEGTTGPGKPKA